MKALVLAGGRGSRINEISHIQNKCMIRLLGKPVLQYNLDILAGLEVSEIIVVVGYKPEEIINEYGNRFAGKKIRYVIQWEQKGLVHAIECAQELLDEDFLLMLGDEILVNPRHGDMIREFDQNDVFALCGVVAVQHQHKISKTYSILRDGDGRILRLIEKPRHPTNGLMGTGNCMFRKEVVSYVGQTPINQQRNEKELPDLIQCAVDEGNTVRSYEICSDYVNLNTREDLAEAERHLNRARARVTLVN